VVSGSLELDGGNVAEIVAALRERPAPVRTRITHPAADAARRMWQQLDADVEPGREARWEAIAGARAAHRPATPPADPRFAEVLARATVLQADSWLRVRATEARAGTYARHVAIESPEYSSSVAPRGPVAYLAVALEEDERVERAFMEVALGDLHVPVRYVRFGETCAGARVIVDGDWDSPRRGAMLTGFGRPVIVASTSGAHETIGPAAVYDPRYPEMLAEAVRAALRLG